MTEDRDKRILIFLALSALLHFAFYVSLPTNILGTQEQAVKSVAILLEPAKMIDARVEPDAPNRKPKPKEPSPIEQPVVAKTQPTPESPKKNEEKPKPVPPAAAPAMLPEAAVTSRGADSESNEAAVPIGKGNDTGGTGFTDSKGTSREIRRIETGAAPAPAPAPPPPVHVAPPPVANVDINAIRAEYAKRISAKIDSVKEYPQGARRRGHEGKAYVLFTVNREGGVSSVSVAKSSGYDTLDAAAQDAVRRAAPFQPLPRELGDAFTLRVPIVFQLSRE
jgi:periplasmic protein TonB